MAGTSRRPRTMTRRPSGGGFGRSGRSGRMRPAWLTELLGRPHETRVGRVLGGIVRARAELTVITILLAGHLMLTTWTIQIAEHIGWVGVIARHTVITELVILVVLLVIPGTRRILSRRCWAVLDRHRIRACFIETRTMTPSGGLPFLLWSSPSPVGERIRVWLRAGLSVNDVTPLVSELAVACYAADARVEVSTRVSTYVIIEIIRRDPLTGRRLVRSNLADLLPEMSGEYADEAFRPLPDRATLPTPTPPAQHPTVTGTRGKKPSHRATTGETTGPTVRTAPSASGVGGTDVSDYV
jgi:hypothetical protein